MKPWMTQSAPAKEIELRRLPGPANNNNNNSSSSNSDGVNPASTAKTRHGNLQLMSRRDTTPEAPAHAASVVPTIWEPYRNRSRLMLTCATTLADGMSDSGAGALIPYMEASGIGEKRYVCTSSSSGSSPTAVAVSIVDVLLGPRCTRAPRPPSCAACRTGSSLSDMGTIRASGSMGGAVWPFICWSAGAGCRHVGATPDYDCGLYRHVTMLVRYSGREEAKASK
ncbi:hypothetical protein MY3296_009628 [Beauveria thailandica]